MWVGSVGWRIVIAYSYSAGISVRKMQNTSFGFRVASREIKYQERYRLQGAIRKRQGEIASVAKAPSAMTEKDRFPRARE